jgi:DNA-binding IclR family transcriptional regulator
LRILSYLARQRGPVAASSIARDLAIPRSALYRLLGALTDHGYAIHYPEQRRYGLGYAAFELGSGFNRQEPLTRLATPVIATMVDRLGETVHLSVLSGTDVVYLIEERAAHRPLLVTDTGVRLPASLTASGRAMLALLPRTQLRALYADVAPTGPDGPTSLRALSAILTTVATDGYATEDEDVAEGFASLAVAVRDRAGWPIASITVTVRRDRYPRESWPELAVEITRYAQEIARRIGGTTAR